MGRREHSFLSILLKPQNFIPPKLGGMGGNGIRIIFIPPKIPLYFQPFILK